MCAQWANTVGWWRFARSDVIWHVFGIECHKTQPDFVLILGFYHNFSITSPKKISCKIFAMSKIQHIFIIEHYLHSHYWTKMSDTFTFNRTNSCPYVRTNHGIFTWIFQWQTRFHWAIAPTKPGPNPIGFFPVRAFKKYNFCHSSSHHRRVEATYYLGNSEHYSENVAKGFPKYDALRCYAQKFRWSAFPAYVMVYKSYFRYYWPNL